MRAVIVFRRGTDYQRTVLDFLEDFRRMSGKKIQEIDPDSIGGQGFCETYNIVRYPTILALTDDGKVLQKWEGLPLPRVGTVSYYAEG